MSWSAIPLVCAIGLLIWSFRRDDFIFSYVTMMVGATAYFVIPGLIHMDRYELFGDSTRMAASFYVTACMIAAARGWLRPMARLIAIAPRYATFPAIMPLACFCAGAIAFSGYFAWKLRGVDPALLETGAWSGPHVIYYFLKKPGYLATSVAAIAFSVTGKRVFAVLAALAALMYLVPPVVAGKRDEVIEAGMIFAVCWVMVLKRRIPNTAVLAAGIFFALVFSAIGVYRSAARSEGVTQGITKALANSAQSQLPPSQRYKEVGNFLAITELTINGARLPNFGLAYWNRLVFSYVPGQIVGHGLKDSLQFEGLELSRQEIVEGGAQPTMGTSYTGFSDTLQAFWFAGPVIFYLIGSLLRSLYLLASSGQAVFLFAYAHLLVNSGVGVTHSTTYVMTAAINFVLFVGVWVHLIQRSTSRGAFPAAQ